MAKADSAEEIDGIAWKFLCSPFTRRDYWDWPLERRMRADLPLAPTCPQIAWPRCAPPSTS